MIAAMAQFQIDQPPPSPPVDISSPMEAINEVLTAMEAGYRAIFDALVGGLPPVEGVTSRTEIVNGVDGNDIRLYIHEPAKRSGPVPAVVHAHGGGMMLGAAADLNYTRWRDELAAEGLVVVGVEFRNGSGELGPHPFPAGLNDCATGTQWVIANKDALEISSVITSGESGGANLSIATTLKAKQDGWLDGIEGVYAQCPYISGTYAAPPPELTSLYENDGYLLSNEMLAPMVRGYDPRLEHTTNPLAWPYFAEPTDLEGLPPHVISVNELDPLRDEGLAYYRKLMAAGVTVSSRTVNGTCHAGDCIFARAIPEVYFGTVRDIASFAWSL
ncbi:MAG: alpha/beta hydrolase [Deltaproteobacteria bacterium]|nr:alpha/beta hydrolase [Deltaproteobacteria bacterium]